MAKDDKISKVLDTVKKDLPKLVKENKGAAIGAVVGYLLADKLSEEKGITTAILGGLVGAFVDDKAKKGGDKF